MKSFKFFTAAILGVALVACSSPKKMAEDAEKVKVTCEPAVMEVVAGSVDVKVSVECPADYFHPQAILEVTPVVVYDGGELALDKLMYQGEKVKDNYKVVAKDGALIQEALHFDFAEGMERCYLELRGKVLADKKTIDLPSKKAADGCITTYMLVKKDGRVDYKADGYQEVLYENPEGQIVYTINSAEVRGKELKGESVKGFKAALEEALGNERKTVTNVAVVAYASPDGGEDLNAKLSDKRAKTAQNAFGKVTKGKEIGSPEVSSVGQDWEGFQELVAESNIEDKDLILRVLSMYSDPEVREREIKNISAVYTTLAKEVLPALRRARFIATVENKNYTSEELSALVAENIEVLDETALLRAATLTDELDAKANIYGKAIEKFGSEVARYNLAVAYLKAGKTAEGKAQLELCNTKDADWNNAMGVVALREGDLEAAAKNFNYSGTAAAKENQGILAILNGNYDEAVSLLANAECKFNKGLANILTGDLAAAQSILDCDCPPVAYLKAVIAARQGNADEVKANLENAKKCEKLAARAEKDIEFAQFE